MNISPQLRKSALALTLLATLLSACGGGGGGGSTYAPDPPGVTTDGNRTAPNPGDQWSLTPAAEVGMDAAILANTVARLPADHGLSSMLVMRQGKPVLEQYWNGNDKDSLHDLRSATKSITSLLMGIAIDQKLVGGVGEPLSQHLGALYPNAPAFQQGVTLRDMLTMSSGLDCDDWVASSPGNEEKMYKQTDWVKFYTSLPAIRPPGSLTRYCTGNPVALGRVIALAAKQAIPAFANDKLFGPLGMSAVKWAQFDQGSQTDTGGHLMMRPRDMIKLGQLALQKGMWNGRQLVSAAWLEESMRQHTQYVGMPLRNGYGYLWWRGVEKVNGKSYDMVFANGNGGQYIIIVPALEIVAVFTGENYNSSKAELPFVILNAYILGAVKVP